jgi:hypothetical protein
MRKAHMQVVIDGLKKRVTDVERERDEARGALHDGLAKLHKHATAHTAALSKLGADIGGLADAVRVAVKPAEPEAPAAEAPSPAPAAMAPATALAADAPASAAEPAAKQPVTPIAARRAAKAAG